MKNKILIRLILIVLSLNLSAGFLYSQNPIVFKRLFLNEKTVSAVDQDTVFDAYVIIGAGQSNGIGSERYTIAGNLLPAMTGTQAHTFTYYKPTDNSTDNGTWQNLNSGVNGSPGAAVTGSFDLGNPIGYYNYTLYGKDTYIIPCSVGGKALDSTFRDVYSTTWHNWSQYRRGDLFDRSVEYFIKRAIRDLPTGKKYKYVVYWSQGETDAYLNIGTATRYNQNLPSFIDSLRIAVPTLSVAPFIIQQLRPDTKYYPYRDSVSLAQVRTVMSKSNTHLMNVFSDSTSLSHDFEHFRPIKPNDDTCKSIVNIGKQAVELIRLIHYGSNNTLIVATGGTVQTVGKYKYHYLRQTDIFKVWNNSIVDSLEVCIVAGGGGGGVGQGTSGGGGGGGGVITNTIFISSGTYSVFVGRGGISSTTVSNGIGENGLYSKFNGSVAIGGGGGASYDAGVSGQNGGSGGGGGTYNGSPVFGPGGTGTIGQGYAGGTGYPYTNAAGGGGGGGAGSIGGNGGATSGGNGGNGLQWYGNYYGGGGGGSTPSSGLIQGLGGLGGGGNGQIRATLPNTGGTPYTGGGAGGSSDTLDGIPYAGSGIVVFRYQYIQ